jgi:hypothetical protein
MFAAVARPVPDDVVSEHLVQGVHVPGGEGRVGALEHLDVFGCSVTTLLPTVGRP